MSSQTSNTFLMRDMFKRAASGEKSRLEGVAEQYTKLAYRPTAPAAQHPADAALDMNAKAYVDAKASRRSFLRAGGAGRQPPAAPVVNDQAPADQATAQTPAAGSGFFRNPSFGGRGGSAAYPTHQNIPGVSDDVNDARRGQYKFKSNAPAPAAPAVSSAPAPAPAASFGKKPVSGGGRPGGAPARRDSFESGGFKGAAEGYETSHWTPRKSFRAPVKTAGLANKEIEVQDIIGASDPAHPGHLTSVEARVMDELVRQRLAQSAKDEAEVAKTATYFMSIEGGREYIEKCAEQGRLLGEQLVRDGDTEAIDELMKTAGYGSLGAILGLGAGALGGAVGGAMLGDDALIEAAAQAQTAEKGIPLAITRRIAGGLVDNADMIPGQAGADMQASILASRVALGAGGGIAGGALGGAFGGLAGYQIPVHKEKTAIDLKPLAALAPHAGATAADIGKEIAPHALSAGLARAAIGAPAGYLAGGVIGKTPEEKERYSRIGAIAGGGLGAASAIGTARGLSADLPSMQLLEHSTGLPGAQAAFKGTSLQQEQAIARAAKQINAQAKTAEESMDNNAYTNGKKGSLPVAPWMSRDGESIAGNQSKVAALSQISVSQAPEPEIDSAAKGSLAVYLEKEAQAQGLLRGLPWGRMAGYGAVGGIAGSALTGDRKNEGRNIAMGVLGGAGLGFGFAPKAVAAAGAAEAAGLKALAPAVSKDFVDAAGARMSHEIAQQKGLVDAAGKITPRPKFDPPQSVTPRVNVSEMPQTAKVEDGMLAHREALLDEHILNTKAMQGQAARRATDPVTPVLPEIQLSKNPDTDRRLRAAMLKAQRAASGAVAPERAYDWT